MTEKKREHKENYLSSLLKLPAQLSFLETGEGCETLQLKRWDVCEGRSLQWSTGPIGEVTGQVASVLLCQECVLSGSSDSIKFVNTKLCLSNVMLSPAHKLAFSS